MIATVQNVIKNIAKVTLKKAPVKLAKYVLFLMLSKERKNFASMARENNFSYKGHGLYFTAHKRNATHGKKEIVFIVSNIIRTAKEHVDAYDNRWSVEKYFRTGKQYIGLAHCQSINADKQKFHIFSVMVTYAILQQIKHDKKKQSIEVIIHDIRRQKRLDYLAEYIDLKQIIMS